METGSRPAYDQAKDAQCSNATRKQTVKPITVLVVYARSDWSSVVLQRNRTWHKIHNFCIYTI